MFHPTLKSWRAGLPAGRATSLITETSMANARANATGSAIAVQDAVALALPVVIGAVADGEGAVVRHEIGREEKQLVGYRQFRAYEKAVGLLQIRRNRDRRIRRDGCCPAPRTT